MMLLTLTFDSTQVSAAEIAEIEERVWLGLKLSGEFNRTLKDNRWVIQYVIEKKLREDALQKITGLENALSVQLRDYAEENSRTKRKTALAAVESDDAEPEAPDDADEEDE